jgi:amidohydrolase
MNHQDLKAKVCDAIDRNRDRIITLGNAIRDTPELGYREQRSAATVTQLFSSFDIPYTSGLALTGVKALLNGGTAGPTVGLLGELDSLPCSDSPFTDPAAGTAHTCGHNAQVANCIGAAIGLKESGVLASLSGRIACLAVPAEEFVEIEYRMELKRKGTIEFLGGKPELVRLGHLDDVDMAMLVHAASGSPGPKLMLDSTTNGFVAKTIRFKGKAAHAGMAPHEGINALNALALAIMNINAQRETFRDADTVRVHQIVIRGGDVVNVVPDDVRMEMFVRARSVEAIEDANAKVDRALRAAAMAVGAEVEIETVPGYLPRLKETALTGVLADNFAALIGATHLEVEGHVAGSTDTGDLSHLMPMAEVKAGGFHGAFHTASHRVADEDLAYVVPAKAMAMAVVDLLADDARVAREILGNFKPKMTKAQYLAYLRSFS